MSTVRRWQKLRLMDVDLLMFESGISVKALKIIPQWVMLRPASGFQGNINRCNQGIRLPINAGQSRFLFAQYRTLFT
jgi:hypothetical protein